MSAEDLALWTHQQVDVLNDVEEELISSVLDAFSPPADLTSHLKRRKTVVVLFWIRNVVKDGKYKNKYLISFLKPI